MSAAAYHVFIERPREAGAAASARLAEAVAARYGIPAPQLIARLAAGRLRVKASVDRATAETFAADLERLGAVCAIVDAATGAPLAAPAPPPAPRTPSPFASGLSAATTSAAAPQDLGALASGDFALATLDGRGDDQPDASPARFGPPSEVGMPASIGPAIAAPDRARSPGPARAASAPPVDRFAPPDAADVAELALDIGPRDRRGGTTAPEPPPPAPVASAAASVDPGAPAAPRAGWIRDRRVQLAAGVGVAILLGFVPATVVASLRERTAYQRIDDEVVQHYRGITTLDAYRTLDPWLATQRARKVDARHGIALGSMLIWALAGAGVAFVWFRKIDWDGVADRLGH